MESVLVDGSIVAGREGSGKESGADAADLLVGLPLVGVGVCRVQDLEAADLHINGGGGMTRAGEALQEFGDTGGAVAAAGAVDGEQVLNLLVTVADLRSGSGSDGIGDQAFAAAEGHAIGAVISEGREDAPVLNGVGVLLIKFDGGEVGGGEVECGGGHVLCLI